LDVINDDEEKLLYEKLKEMFHDLDNLCEITKIKTDEKQEEIYKLEITSYKDGTRKNIIRLPKKKTGKLLKLEDGIRSKLSDDKHLNIASLTKLLQEQLKDE